MDVNGTRFHLLLGAPDWERCLDCGGALAGRLGEADCDLAWDARHGAIRLRPLLAFHRTPVGGARLRPEDRRGAARDRYGNWFRIDDRGTGIVARSAGAAWAPWWPATPPPQPAPVPGRFGACPAAPTLAPSPHLAGLAITADHYLVAGLVEPAGILVFDLHANGPPRWRLWPAGVPFAPFAIATRPGGGVFVLDRENARLWALDRRLDLPTGLRIPGTAPAFAAAGAEPRATPLLASPNPLAVLAPGAPPTPIDAVAVIALQDGSALLLEAQGADGFAAVWRATNGSLRGPASTAAMTASLAPEAREGFFLVGHDLAVLSDGAVAIATPEGDQAFAFTLGLDADAPTLEPLPDHLPMRLFGGQSLTTTPDGPFYDSGPDGRPVPLVAQRRPRHTESATFVTPIFDGREAGCVWHRLMLDMALPQGAAVKVASVANDDRAALLPAATDADALASLAWGDDEPTPYRRADGPERPFGDAAVAARFPTHETLFQAATGRWLRLRVTLAGDGRATPRLRALRAWYPRFSWTARYLPAVYREDAASASLLDRMLANLEGLLTGIEERIAAAHLLLSARTAPAEALEWLAGFFGVVLDPRWDAHRRRLLLRHAVRLFELRGTARGLSLALHLALDAEVCNATFAESPARPDPIRLVERFRTRRFADVQLGLAGGGAPAAAPVAGRRWRAEDGAAALDVRWRAARGLPPGARYPVLAPTDAMQRGAWERFSRDTLGFVPGGTATGWIDFVARRRGSPAPLPPTLPTTLPDLAPALGAWVLFQQAVAARTPLAHRFTVMLPVGFGVTPDPVRVALAQRIVALERPAHTAFDVRLFWAMFRLGEARLGLDTALGAGSRDAALMPSFVLGRDAVGGAHLAPGHPADLPDRVVLDRDRVADTARLGGP